MNAPTITLHSTCSDCVCPCTNECDLSPRNAPLFTHGEEVRFDRGRTIWSRGESADFVLAICTGVLAQTRTWKGRKEVVVNLACRGDVIGAEAVMPDGKRPFGCRVIEPVKAVAIDRKRLGEILLTNPELRQPLLECTLAEVGQLADHLPDLGSGRIPARLAKILLRIADRLAIRDARGLFIPVKLRRTDLADMLACRSETVIRVMTKWEREGLVHTQREGLVLMNAEALREIAAS